VLKISKRLRRFAIKRFKLKADVGDTALRKVIGKQLIDGGLSAADVERLNRPVVDPAAGGKGGPAPKKKAPAPAPKKAPAAKPGRKAGTPRDVAREARRQVRGVLKRMGIGPTAGAVNPASAFTKATRVRVKEAAENYGTDRKAATYPMVRGFNGGLGPHPLAGQPARFDGRSLDHPSDRDKAVALAWVRFMAQKSANGQPLPRWLRMTDHDRELVLYAAHNEKWSGRIETRDSSVRVFNREKLGGVNVKTLLDDSVSGGIEITPVVFDDALILIPILYGELFPYVNVQTIARGRRIKGGSVINPEFTWGTGEGTAITPFNTASYVSAFDTPIYPAVAAIELGQDFEEDSPVDLGGQVVEQFGLKALETLDRVIAVGNGYSEPLGIFNTTGATLVNSVFGAGGPLTVSDFEGLMFGLPKQFRKEAGAALAYLSNDYTYRKARAIQVGEGDQRRVFGLNHGAYELLDTQYRIQNSIPDGYAAYANLRRYRMYRRLGMQVRVETGGRQLALSNTRLIVVRMRYGGQLELGQAAALMKDAQVM